MDAGLYIVDTPIGNLADATFRSLEILKAADLIMAEDTRHSLKLLNHYEIKVPLQSCHKFNEASREQYVLEKIANGAAVALITDSGMPAVSDPGSRLVSACRKAGAAVTVIPGPSAVTAAIALSGMGGDRFLFEGYLQPKSAARRRRLEELIDISVPVVLFESPHRFLKLVTEMSEIMPEREVFVGRELTKKFEESVTGTPDSILERFSERSIKGEFVLVLAPKGKERKRKT